MDYVLYTLETINKAPRHWYLCAGYGQVIQTAAEDVIEGMLILCPCGRAHEWRRIPAEYTKLGP